MRYRGWFALVLLGCLGLVTPARAYTLLGFPSDGSVQTGSFKRWQLEQAGPPSINLSYAIESSFLSTVPGAQQAAVNAFSSWNAASSVLSFTPVAYQPVVNSWANWINPQIGNFAWEGPGAALGAPGIGANIDIMARPPGFSFTWQGRSFEMTSSILGFAVPTGFGGEILSADLYLNSAMTWSTAGGHFDIETVVLHELGHILGLDHPEEAEPNGAVNYDPYTHQPGAPWSTGGLMHSGYWPDGINRIVGDDEVGGIAFLYPGVPGDANLDAQFGFADVDLAISVYFGISPRPNPEAFHNLDLNRNGTFEFSEVDTMICWWFSCPTAQSARTEFSLSLIESMGYDVSGLPEPATGLFVLFATFLLVPAAKLGRLHSTARR